MTVRFKSLTAFSKVLKSLYGIVINFNRVPL
jgi:hypothetical protein